jgi:DNA repair exonuclease SbcCD ATPase subunit
VLRGKARVRAFDAIGQDLIEYRLHLSADNRRRDWLAINSVVDVVVSRMGSEVTQNDAEWRTRDLVLRNLLEQVKAKCSADLQDAREATQEAWRAKDATVTELRQLQSHRDELASALVRARQANIESIEESKRERDELLAQLEGAEGLVERLEVERNRADIAERQLSQAREEMESVKQQRDKLLIRVDSVEHRKLESAAAMSSENERLLRRRCDELAAKLNEARGALEQLQCQADGDVPMLRQRIVELVADGYELGEKLGHEQAKVAELTHRRHKAAEQLARLRRQHARLLLELAAEVT